MKNSECMVSVLCAAFNHEDYIREALDSFIGQQTDFSFEILVNDDASTDATADILREYQAKYPEIVKPVYQKENQYSQGKDICNAILYPLAQGKYIALCEGDDYWSEPTKLQQQVDFLEANPEYSGCAHNTTLHYCAGDQADKPLLRFGKDCDVPIANVVRGMSYSFHTSSLMARRDIIIHSPDYFFVGLKYGFTDQPEALWLMTNGPVRYMDKCMSVYRINSGTGAWSTGVDGQYDKLRRFIRGEIAMLRAFLPHAPEQWKAVVERGILQDEFELLYIEGRDRDQRKPPYAALLREKPLSYRVKNLLKCAFPFVIKLYRRKKGFGGE